MIPIFMSVFLGLALQAPPAKPQSTQVLVLGVFHFDSPGLDMFNTRVKDVLGERRQKEILEIVKRLEEFRPTRIAVEAPYGSDAVQKRFLDYCEGKYQLKASEIDQIGFRIAKNLGHKSVYSIDFKQDMDMDAMFKSAKENGQDGFLQKLFQDFGAKIQHLIAEDQVERTSILKLLMEMNSEEFEQTGLGMYLTLLRIGNGNDYAGADLVGGWYTRNLKITANIMRIAENPDDRVLVLIGSGHAAMIRQFLSQTPGYSVIDVKPYLKP